MESIHQGKKFDIASLENEMVAALEADRKYKATDEMKKRAITMASSYDEFKNFVACADLKPLTQKEIRELHPSQRSVVRSRYKKSNKTEPKVAKTFPAIAPSTAPKNSREFIRMWRRHCTNAGDKYRYLKLTGAKRLSQFYKSELEVDLMLEMVRVLSEGYKEHQEQEFTLDILKTLTETGRFSLNLGFFSFSDRETLQHLLQNVSAEQPEQQEKDVANRVAELSKAFDIE